MNDNQKPSDFVLLAAGVMTVIGSFCPWISVSFISVRGTDGWRGLVVIVAGIVVSVFAASRLWESLVNSEFKRRLHYLSIFSAVISIGVLSEVGLKTLKAASEIGNLNNSDELGLGDFGDALGDFSTSIVSALKPKIAFGWYLSAFSLISAFVLIMLKMRKIENASEDVTHQKMEGAFSAGTIVIKRKTLVVSLTALVLVVVSGLFVFSEYISSSSSGTASKSSSGTASKSSSDTASTVYIGNTTVPKTCFGDYCTGDTGPGGGTIIYVDKAGFGSSDGDDKSIASMCLTGTCHYLEIAPTYLPGQYSWDDAIGAAETYSRPSFNDWVLPSKDALNEWFMFSPDRSNFGTNTYWSSTVGRGDGTQAWAQDFSLGSQYLYKRNALYVRPMRAF